MNQKNRVLISAILCGLLALADSAFAQGTAFTYQGQLNCNGFSVTGSFDFTFTLFTTNSGGAPIAGPLTNTAVAVSNGLFTTSIDFGNSFNGANNWLEIAVSTNGANVFTTLAPRQQLTPVPYAITAANLSGSIPLSQLPTNLITNGAIGVSFFGVFTGNGAGLTNLPPPATYITNATFGPTYGTMVADANNVSVEYFVTNNLVFDYATNGIPGQEILRSIYLYGATSNTSLIFPTNWIFFNCTATNAIESNAWTAVHLRFRGDTSSAASQTNVMVKLESQ